MLLVPFVVETMTFARLLSYFPFTKSLTKMTQMTMPMTGIAGASHMTHGPSARRATSWKYSVMFFSVTAANPERRPTKMLSRRIYPWTPNHCRSTSVNRKTLRCAYFRRS